MSILLSIPVGNSLMVYYVHRSCVVTFAGHKTWVDFIFVDMLDFDILVECAKENLGVCALFKSQERYIYFLHAYRLVFRELLCHDTKLPLVVT